MHISIRMKKRVALALLVLSFVFTAVLLAATFRDKQLLKKERATLILRNDSLHIQQLEAKQKLTKLSKRLDSLESKQISKK
jgi:NhaP-type Na+/H+ and K+/H+ antiporter